MGRYYMGIDQGTTGTTVLLLDEEWNCLSKGYARHTQYFPKPGWVEHDPVEIWEKVLEAVNCAVREAKADIREVSCIGLDNQGETVVLWDKVTGIPVYNAIVWQDKRTSREADAIRKQCGDLIRARTGLPVDAYFSATKIRWIIDHVPGVREKILENRIYAGTLDAWLLWKMTRGKVFATDPSTASRTMLFNLHTGAWDEEILRAFSIPKQILPQIRGSAEVYGYTDPAAFFGADIPISGSVTDQQAALFGQTCFEPGAVKTTYGTGCFMLMNTGKTPVFSENGLLTTVGWKLCGETTYALDGGIYTAGAAVGWLRDRLKIISSAEETEKMAQSVPDTGGVFFVPAFSGLAAPYWDQYARGTIAGITGGTLREHIVRAALESVAYQVKDNLDAMTRDSGLETRVMRADGGAAVNGFLMQFQADILGIPVDVPAVTETTALGAAYLASCGIGALNDLGLVKEHWKLKKRYEPRMDDETRRRLLYRWHKAVERSKKWEGDWED